jgi:hypothetical protein
MIMTMKERILINLTLYKNVLMVCKMSEVVKDDLKEIRSLYRRRITEISNLKLARLPVSKSISIHLSVKPVEKFGRIATFFK